MALLALRILSMIMTGALIALMLYAGEPAKLWWWFLAIPFGAWITGPAITPYILAKKAKRGWFIYVMIGFLTLSSMWSTSVYYQTFFVSTSSTSALVMIFAPMYQWLALTLVGLLSAGAFSVLDRHRSSQ